MVVSSCIVAIIIGLLSVLGATAGAHRLWAHRSYSASLPIRVLLMICQTALGQVGKQRHVLLYVPIRTTPSNTPLYIFQCYMFRLVLIIIRRSIYKTLEISRSDIILFARSRKQCVTKYYFKRQLRFLGAFTKFAESDCQLSHVRQSAWNHSAPTVRIFMKFDF